MAAFDYTQPANASIEPLSYAFKIRGNTDVRGMLWTARYGVAGPNTITIQFPDLLNTASTATSSYTLLGPSVPSISSVTFTANTRIIVLNLSGALSAVNTYTLKILPDTVLSENDPNWPNLVVDVILPATIACIGVGVDQTVILGSPNINMNGDAVGLGFEQPITLGDPTAQTSVRPDGLGFEQLINFGTPTSLTAVRPNGIGIEQLIELGSPSVIRQLQPLGVGIAQLIDFGSPVGDLNPITLSNLGINQDVSFGSPEIVGPGAFIGKGINQTIAVGTPRAIKELDKEFLGIGIGQLIELGLPGPASPDTIRQVGIEQFIPPGTPVVSTNLGVTFRQKIALLDLDAALHKAFGEGVTQVALPNAIEPMNGYLTQMSTLQQTQTRLPFKLAAAASIFAFNIPGAFPDTNDNDVAPIAKLSPSGQSGSLIFVDGRLVIKTDPF